MQLLWVTESKFGHIFKFLFTQFPHFTEDLYPNIGSYELFSLFQWLSK